MEVFVTEEKMSFFFCKHCQEMKAIPSRRGHLPETCASCANDGSAKVAEDAENRSKLQIAAELRCDRLELMLRSRNTHIKQQKDWDK